MPFPSKHDILKKQGRGKPIRKKVPRVMQLDGLQDEESPDDPEEEVEEERTLDGL